MNDGSRRWDQSPTLGKGALATYSLMCARVGVRLGIPSAMGVESFLAVALIEETSPEELKLCTTFVALLA